MQAVRAASPRECEPVGVGVRISCVHRFEPDGRAGGPERGGRIGQPWVVGIPAEQAAEESHVGALRLVRGGQRAGAVKLEDKRLGRAADEVAG